MDNPEQHNVATRHDADTRDTIRIQSSEHLGIAIEASPEQTARQIENRRNEVRQVFAQEAGNESRTSEGEPRFVRAVQRVTSEQKRIAYQATMTRIRSGMSKPVQTFSRFIHNNGVEKASNAIGQTLARPNAVLSGSTGALIVVSLTYVLAKIYGYPLSGFETIGTFILGWIVGLVYDYTRTLISGRVR